MYGLWHDENWAQMLLVKCDANTTIYCEWRAGPMNLMKRSSQPICQRVQVILDLDKEDECCSLVSSFIL